MQLVYFLVLPSAMLAAAVERSCIEPNPLNDPGDISSLASPFIVEPIIYTSILIGCFAVAARWLYIAQRQIQSMAVRSRQTSYVPWVFRNRDSLVLWSWCMLQPMTLAASGWAGMIRWLSSDSSFHLLSISLWLLPSVVLFLLLDCIRAATHLRRSENERNGLTNWGLALRRYGIYSWFLPITAPVIIAGLLDVTQITRQALGLLWVSNQANGAIIEAMALIILSGVFAAIVLPELFIRSIGAKPLTAELAHSLAQCWSTYGDRPPRILLWSTHCSMTNAAVVGMIGPWKKLLVTDALLMRLTNEELSLVVMHELAHCRRYHAWIRLLPTVITVIIAVALLGLLEDWWLAIGSVSLFTFFVASLIGVCWWSEFDADRFAVEYARNSGDRLVGSADRTGSDPAQVLASALRKIYGSQNRKRSSWLHPSCQGRLANLDYRVSDRAPDVIVKRHVGPVAVSDVQPCPHE